MKMTKKQLLKIIKEELTVVTDEQTNNLMSLIEDGEVEMIRYLVDTLNIKVPYGHPIIAAIIKSKNLDAGQKYGLMMNLIDQESLRQTVKEEARDVLSEQSLRKYLIGQGMPEEEMMDMMELRGGMEMLNLIRDFEFKILPNTSLPTWQREAMWDLGTHKKLEIQTITLFGEKGAIFTRHGPRWESGPEWRKKFRETLYDDLGEAAEKIAKLITPPEKEMFLGQMI